MRVRRCSRWMNWKTELYLTAVGHCEEVGRAGIRNERRAKRSGGSLVEMRIVLVLFIVFGPSSADYINRHGAHFLCSLCFLSHFLPCLYAYFSHFYWAISSKDTCPCIIGSTSYCDLVPFLHLALQYKTFFTCILIEPVAYLSNHLATIVYTRITRFHVNCYFLPRTTMSCFQQWLSSGHPQVPSEMLEPATQYCTFLVHFSISTSYHIFAAQSPIFNFVFFCGQRLGRRHQPPNLLAVSTILSFVSNTLRL